MFLNFETMKSMLRLLPFLLPVLLTVVGCSDADNEPPSISNLSITPTPSAGIICGSEDGQVISVNTGDSILISFTVSDNEELSQYKIDVHNNFDCHGHGKLETSVWEILDIVDLQGLSQQVNYTLSVPDTTTAGSYHLSIQVADFFGNSAKTEYFSIQVKNLEDTVAPTLTVTEPSVSAFTVNLSDTLSNDSIRFTGIVADNRDLEERFAYRNFIPYVQLHEFETLLLSAPDALCRFYPDKAKEIKTLKAEIAGIVPEEINDTPQGAPSKRIIKHLPRYERQKTTAGVATAEVIGLPHLRAKCPHFNDWVARLESI